MAIYLSNNSRLGSVNLENYSKGCIEGKNTEQDTFWETFQQSGRRNNYRAAFRLWPDSCYNPKYPIICSSQSVAAVDMFRESSITDTKVDIIVNNLSTDFGTVFHGCKHLRTIHKLSFTEDVVPRGAFTGCTALENITFDGVIGHNIDFYNSPLLSHESLVNIIDHLKDYSNEVKETADVAVGVPYMTVNGNTATLWANGASVSSVHHGNIGEKSTVRDWDDFSTVTKANGTYTADYNASNGKTYTIRGSNNYAFIVTYIVGSSSTTVFYYSVEPPDHILTIGTANMEKLSDAEKTLVKNKNWGLS